MADTNGNHAGSHNSPPCMRALTDAQSTDWVGDWGHLFCADRKLWSKTSISRWANAISAQQPYHLHKQWVLPRGIEPLFGSVCKQWKREARVIFWNSLSVIKSCMCLGWEREREVKCVLSTWGRMLSHRALISFTSLSGLDLMNTPQLWSVHTARDMPPVKVFFLPPKHNR